MKPRLLLLLLVLGLCVCCAGTATAQTKRIDLSDVQKLVNLSDPDRKSTRLNSSHSQISYAVFCLKKNKFGLGDPNAPRAASAQASPGERPAGRWEAYKAALPTYPAQATPPAVVPNARATFEKIAK